MARTQLPPASATLPDIVGREAELAALRTYVDDARQGSTALVLEGEPGVGKSTLWLAGVEHARANGLRVLSSRPAETEYDLAHVGLGDLLEDVLDEALPTLTLARRRALEVALLRNEAPGDRVDRRALAVALRDVLQHLGEREPILVAVDDVQWLDASSAAALAFALRRLSSSRILVLLARRLAPGTPAQATELERALAPEDVQRLPVGPLSAALSIESCSTGWAGRSRARRFCGSTSARGAIRSSRWSWPARSDADVDPLEPLPVPETLDELLRARIAGLPASTHEALALVAALGTTSDSFLARAGVAPDALEPAVGFARDRARRRGDSLHASAPVVGRLPRPRRQAATRSRADRTAGRRSRPARASRRARRKKRRMPPSRPRSTTPSDWPSIAARPQSRRSSPSTPFD